jgi:cysteinyl-tRNA synthetase
MQLEREVQTWEKKNEALKAERGEREARIHLAEQSHRQQIDYCQRNISAYSQQCEVTKNVREELTQLAREQGLERTDPL